MSTTSHTPSLTPSRLPSPPLPIVQPDHFYGSEGVHFPPSPNSNGRTWLEPGDDPVASRGIPVFKPTMEEFEDFEGYMNKIEGWGMRSGIVKVIPPKQWTDSLPPITDQLASVKLKNPIEQHMLGHGGLFRQQNVEKRRVFSVREWAELCHKDDRRPPGVDSIDLRHARRAAPPPPPKSRAKRGERTRGDVPKAELAGPVPILVIDKADDTLSTGTVPKSPNTPPLDGDSKASIPPADPSPGDPQSEQPTDVASLPTPERLKEEESDDDGQDGKPQKAKAKRKWQTREMREAHLAERAAADAIFLKSFNPKNDWLPPNTRPEDYTTEFCRVLERQYWRNCGFGTPAMYGADMEGRSLFTDQTKSWNVAHLPSLLSRLLPSSSGGLPGVNTPYLYFGMWRATFAWHVEDMDLFSINYIHFGAGKYWYAVPQARASALEQTMKSHFPEPSRCPQFLRHKSYLASPMMLAKTSCRPNTLVQHAGEFVITFPRGYHAGFNLGFNCAESVNFALDSWIELGRKAQACNCVDYSVRIDVDELLRGRELSSQPITEADMIKSKSTHSSSRKRKSDENDTPNLMKKAKISTQVHGVAQPKVTIRLKLGPRPPELEPYPCCLCVSTSRDDLLPIHDRPLVQHPAHADIKVWMAHENCARVLPETWLDEVETDPVLADGTKKREKMVFGVDAIVKDRWNLKCSFCSKNRPKMHGAPIQCTRGKCSKAFHVSCAREGAEHGIVYKELGEVEKDVVLVDMGPTPTPSVPIDVSVDDAVSPPQGTSDAVDAMVCDRETIKVVKKVEYQLLCPQHNPLMLEAKKANKQDKIRKDLLALEPMSRIKIRVSAGIFEVSLVRVIEESNSVEVLWDRGIKREFKWGSVVFGDLGGQTVGQKPAEAAPESELCQAGPSAKPPQPPATTTIEASAASQAAYVSYQPRTGTYPAWGYHYPSFPTAIAASTVPPTATHGDPVTSITASGTFAYPYTGVQYSTGQSAYVAPPIKYPYGAPALPAATSSPSVGAKSALSNVETQKEQTYNGILWKRPYTGPRDSTTPVDSQAPNEPSPPADRRTPTPTPDKVGSPLTDLTPSSDSSVPPSASKELTS
ncbi:JmjC domain, hydroxylase-domain-containing protein [Lactarius hatsudake]|nr:JmjC domain, hydroxylase-domain-containing protein [Lactarius hatsudake]